jgi:hypothetical protein
MITSACSRATGRAGSSALWVTMDTDGALAAKGCCVTFDAAIWAFRRRSR